MFSRHFLARLLHPGQLTPTPGSLELSRRVHLMTKKTRLDKRHQRGKEIARTVVISLRCESVVETELYTRSNITIKAIKARNGYPMLKRAAAEAVAVDRDIIP